MSDWQADLLAALAALETSPAGDGLTTDEVARQMGWSLKTANDRIRQQWRDGQIECCRKWITNRAGCRQSVPAYRKKAHVTSA